MLECFLSISYLCAVFGGVLSAKFHEENRQRESIICLVGMFVGIYAVLFLGMVKLLI